MMMFTLFSMHCRLVPYMMCLLEGCFISLDFGGVCVADSFSFLCYVVFLRFV
jgi:hypothetical protein